MRISKIFAAAAATLLVVACGTPAAEGSKEAQLMMFVFHHKHSKHLSFADVGLPFFFVHQVVLYFIGSLDA